MLGTWGNSFSAPKAPRGYCPCPCSTCSCSSLCTQSQGTCSTRRWRGLTGTFALFFPEVWYDVTPGGPKGTGLISRALSSAHGTWWQHVLQEVCIILSQQLLIGSRALAGKVLSSECRGLVFAFMTYGYAGEKKQQDLRHR